MPIIMVDDPNDQQDNSSENPGGGRRAGGGGGGLIQFLPMVLGFLIRKPKLLLIVLAVGAIFYFRGGCNIGNLQQMSSGFSLGGVLDPKQFDKAPIYEGLSEGKANLPESVSLLKFAPDRLNQGEQGSCVAWSSAYGARTILEAQSTGKNPNEVAFSPAFMYNQIGLDGCQGSYIIRAMENMTHVGAIPFKAFPYDERDCDRQPSEQLKQSAKLNKMIGFTRLTNEDRIDVLNLHAIKEHLSHDLPVVIGMMVGGSFMQTMEGKEVWHPESQDYSQIGFGGHAMCVIGYNDRLEGGAFQIMNSWGSDWGKNGIAWVKYSDFKHFVREAYGLNPMPLSASVANKDLEVSIGLVENNVKKYIPLQLKSGNVFQTKQPIKTGTQFKMEVKNSVACYVYILGMQTDGSSYVLFPYPSKEDPAKTKFSPYCGITGYRLFPRGMSMMADNVGNKDYMAVVVSKDSLNIFQLNSVVNSNKSIGFPQAVNRSIQEKAIKNVNFYGNAEGTINLKAAVNNGTAVSCIVEVDKK